MFDTSRLKKIWGNTSDRRVRVIVAVAVCLAVIAGGTWFLCRKDRLTPLVPVTADTLFVDGRHGRSGNGSQTHPFRSIGEALVRAEAIDVRPVRIEVASGEYRENLVFPGGINLAGAGIGRTVIQGFLHLSGETSVEQLTIDAGGVSAMEIEKDIVATLDRIEIRNHGKTAIKKAPGGGRLVLTRSVIRDGKAKAIYVESDNELFIADNVISGHPEEALDLRPGIKGEITRNAVYGNEEAAIEFIIGDSDLSIHDNYFRQNGSSNLVAQFLDTRPGPGRVSIERNYAYNQRDYAFNCKAPSGGDVPSNYWRVHLVLKDNFFEATGGRPALSVSGCKFAYANPTTSVATGLEKSVQFPFGFTAARAADERHFRAELEKTAREYDRTSMESRRAAEKLDRRSNLRRFLIGSDPRSLELLESQLERYRMLRDRLTALAGRSVQPGAEETRERFAQELEAEYRRISDAIQDHRKRPSLFGWALRH